MATKRKDGRYVETAVVQGVRKYFYGDTAREARKKMLEHAQSLERGRLFKEVAEQRKSRHYERLTRGAETTYNKPYETAIKEFGERPVKDISVNDINSFVKKISAKGYSKRTVKAYVTVLKLIFDQAMIDKDILINPAQFTSVPKSLKTVKRTPPSDGYIEIIEQNKELSQMGVLGYFVLYTGLRKGEALALKWEDVDFSNNIIKINKEVEWGNNQPKLVERTKSEAGVRDVVLMNRLKEFLLTKKQSNEQLIFPGNHGLMTKSEYSKRWIRYCIDTGMARERTIKDGKTGKDKIILTNNITLHQLRHAYATMLYEAGVDVKAAMRQTGHKSEAVLREIYTHLREKINQETADKLNNFEWNK